jgi:tetratricopeptide (TPR) repeat protein
MLRTLGAALVLVLFLAGASLVAYARWTRPIADADTALADGRLDDAIAGYRTGETRFDQLPAARQLFESEYARAYGNHLWALYRAKRYDDVIDLAERGPADAAPHFFSGCAFFLKGAAEEQPETRLGWFTRAEEEFRKALESAPGDWDTKYDFELTTRLASELRKQPKTPPKQLMQLLRPPQAGTKQQRRVG